MWLVVATLASAFWGLTYVFGEQVYKYISIYTTISINALIIGFFYLFVAQTKGVLKTDITTISTTPKVVGLIACGVIVFAIAELFIALSITSKNATLAGLIEITYPLFIALFAYILFREAQLNLGIAVGGIIIFVGVVIVYWFSK